ncbi:MAG: phosphoenolpyruvate synthase, partial [Patescibacteria group bacterium]
MTKLVVWFKDVDKHDLEFVGGKGANLGEMTKIGIPVPNGFIVTAQAYYLFLEKTGIKDDLERILHRLDVSQSHKLETAAKKAQEIISSAEIPTEVAKEIVEYYHAMGKILRDPYVAVRSSATAEDLPNASFAGQQATFLNIKGEASVVHHVRLCWASLFTARAIFYRVENKFDHFKVGIAVPVQKMVQSDVSGIMFTINPVTSEKSTIVIEGIYGLGELIVQGAVTPDHYEVDKNSLEITHKKINSQEKQMLLKRGKTIIDYVPQSKRALSKITDAQVTRLAEFGKLLEKHYYLPQDIEWAIEKGRIYITQTRPITTIKKTESTYLSQAGDRHEVSHTHIVLLKGDPASPGIASGPVRIIKSVDEIDKVKPGDILVAPQTNPDYVPAMRKVVAIVTETGGRTSHAAIVSRELGIPAVVGVVGALKELKTGQVVTVHGSRGVIYKGGIYISAGLKTETPEIKSLTPGNVQTHSILKTATKLYVNLAEPEKAHEVAKMRVEGVGLLRAEFMIAGIGTHPKKFIKDHKQHVFVNELSNKLAVFCEAFHPRPVVYRATDFRTNEYRNLKGGKDFEPEEANPMLGFRGCFRYLSDPAVFNLELEAIKRVRNKLGF